MAHALGVAGLLGVGGVAARPAMAQALPTDEPVLITRRADLELFQLAELNLALEAEWRRDVDEIEPRGGPKRKDTADRFEEFLDVDAVAFVGHPNLLQLSLDGRFGLRQRRFDLSDSPTERINDTLINYDLSALFIQNTKTPITLYMRQFETDVNRQFAGDLTDEITEYGVRLLVRDETTPLQVQAYRREQEQKDRANNEEFSYDENTLLMEGQVQMGDAGAIWWDYTYNDIDQSGRVRASRSFERQEGNLTHTWDFGPGQRHNLRSTLRLYRETSELDLKQFQLNQRLRVRHTENLQSSVDFREEHIDRRDADLRNRDLRYTLQHQLFESLTSVGEVGARWTEIPTDDFTSDEIFTRGSLDYTKKTPGGRIYAGARASYSRIDASDRGSPILVLDDARTFDGTDLIVIDRQNIVPTSIVITDVTGIIFYTENIDYTVVAFPDSVQIQRLITGTIAPGQTVLIDYEIGPEPGGITTTDVYNLVARYRFEEGWLRGLSPYVRYTDQNQDRSFDTGDPATRANEFTSFIYGTDYDIWKISLTAEQEVRRSSLSPFERTRLIGRYVDRFQRGNVLIFTAQYQEIDRTDENVRTSTTTLSGELGMQVTERLRGTLLLQWRYEDGNNGFDSQAFEQELNLRWVKGRTTVYSRIRNSYIDSSSDDTLLQTFVVGFRREF